MLTERLISDIKSYIELPHLATRSRQDGLVEVRFYFDVKGRKKVQLREKQGTAAFLREYACAEKGIPYSGAPIIADSAKPVVARSFRWLCQQYFKRADESPAPFASSMATSLSNSSRESM